MSDAPAPHAAGEEYLSTQEAMDALEVSRGTLYKLVKNGMVERIRIPGFAPQYPKSQCSKQYLVEKAKKLGLDKRSGQ